MNKIKNEYQPVGKLFVSKVLYNFVNKELLKKTKIKSKQFWYGLDKSLYYLREKNERLLQTRKDLQNSIDDWHLKNKGKKLSNKLSIKNFDFGLSSCLATKVVCQGSSFE